MGADAVSHSPLIGPYLYFWEGNVETATKAFAAALATLPASQAEPWWDRFERADLELGLGRSLRVSGRLQEAKRLLRSSLGRFGDIASKEPSPRVERRLGRGRAELAKVLLALGGPGRTVSPLAGSAAAWFRQAGGLEQEILELERLSRGDVPAHDHHGGERTLPQ
jgi:tetratricopeptide (TPR) repeat protein